MVDGGCEFWKRGTKSLPGKQVVRYEYFAYKSFRRDTLPGMAQAIENKHLELGCKLLGSNALWRVWQVVENGQVEWFVKLFVNNTLTVTY